MLPRTVAPTRADEQVKARRSKIALLQVSFLRLSPSCGHLTYASQHMFKGSYQSRLLSRMKEMYCMHALKVFDICSVLFFLANDDHGLNSLPGQPPPAFSPLFSLPPPPSPLLSHRYRLPQSQPFLSACLRRHASFETPNAIWFRTDRFGISCRRATTRRRLQSTTPRGDRQGGSAEDTKSR